MALVSKQAQVAQLGQAEAAHTHRTLTQAAAFSSGYCVGHDDCCC